MSFDPVIERQIERQMKSDWWNRFMLSGYAYHHEPHQWREALGVRGLYALSTGMKIVYVGKANCIGTRIKTHRRDQWMPFQAWSYQDLSDLSNPSSTNSKPMSSKSSTPSSTSDAPATSYADSPSSVNSTSAQSVNSILWSL